MSGLRPGKDIGKGKKTGIYAFRTADWLLLRVATVHTSHSAPVATTCSSGQRLMLHVQSWRAGEEGIGAISVGAGQWCLQPQIVHIRGFFMHIMTPEDVDTIPQGSQAANHHYYAGRRTPPYEIDFRSSDPHVAVTTTRPCSVKCSRAGAQSMHRSGLFSTRRHRGFQNQTFRSWVSEVAAPTDVHGEQPLFVCSGCVFLGQRS